MRSNFDQFCFHAGSVHGCIKSRLPWSWFVKAIVLAGIALLFAIPKCQAFELGIGTDQEQCVDVVTATSNHSVTIWVHGTGDSSQMKLRLRNNLSAKLEICVEIGTELKPNEASVQKMVVVEEVKITLKAKAEDEITLEVNCLDISKDAPSTNNVNWVIQNSDIIAKFIRCTNGVLNATISSLNTQQEKDMIEGLRPFFIQAALWQARGATRQQWIDFWVHYQEVPPDKASQLADSLTPLLTQIVQTCGTLSNFQTGSE
jgi:hypothetical protein